MSRKIINVIDLLVILSGLVMPKSDLPFWILLCAAIIAAEHIEYHFKRN